MKISQEERIQQLVTDWTTNPRWEGIERPYSAEEVARLAGSYKLDYSIARMGAERLWNLLKNDNWVAGLGALTGNQAVQESPSRYESYLFVWLASSSRCELVGQYVS
jgi:isocitrate lyase